MPRGPASFRGPGRARNQLMKNIIISYTKFMIYVFLNIILLNKIIVVYINIILYGRTCTFIISICFLNFLIKPKDSLEARDCSA